MHATLRTSFLRVMPAIIAFSISCTREKTLPTDTGNNPSDTLGSPEILMVNPAEPTILVSATQQFTVTSNRGVVAPTAVTWSVVGGGGTITSSGLFTADSAPGTTIVKAAKGNVSGTARVTVAPGSPAILIVSPAEPTILVSATQQFTATSNHGPVVPSTITWSVQSGSGTITSSGLFTAGSSPGTTIVKAARGNVSGTATVTVAAGRLVFSRQPGPTPVDRRILSLLHNDGGCHAGGKLVLPITIQARDGAGRLMPNEGTVTLTLASNPGGGMLSGSLSEASQDPNPVVRSDVAFPEVRINATGNGYTLTASSPGMLSATSEPFDIVPSADAQAVRLFFDRVVCTSGETNNFWVAGAVVRFPIEVIAVADNWTLQHGTTGEVTANNLAGTYSGPVTLSVESGGRLSGTLTVTAVDGRAKFSDLVAHDPGHYVVIASAPGLVTNRWEFDVVATAP
jgi:hypothetical protein